MDDLIDDALVAILKRLPLSERIRLEAVCRRWYEYLLISFSIVVRLSLRLYVVMFATSLTI